jgi:hypothetical protein
MKDKRDQCRQNIMALLRNTTGEASIEEIVSVYHVVYGCMPKYGKYRYRRQDRASTFVAAMEKDGLVRCTYNGDGGVTHVRIA